MQTIRQQLDQPIRQAGITAVANAVGLDRANLSRWLAGRGRLADEHVEAICRHLKLSITITPVG